VFQARIAAEATDGTGYTIDDVAEGIVAKLIRRHPHVFADVTVPGPEEVKRNWDAIKAAERAGAGGTSASVLDTVPFGQPALTLAAQLQRRAERAGAPADLADLSPGGHAGGDVPGGDSDSDRHGSDSDSDRYGSDGDSDRHGRDAGSDGAAGGRAVSDVGAELFALVARARRAGLDPELELRAAARAYRDRVRAWERPGRR
jgi:XTP/dITP diphosphohydrolase